MGGRVEGHGMCWEGMGYDLIDIGFSFEMLKML